MGTLQKFNIGKFNVPVNSVVSITAIAEIEIGPIELEPTIEIYIPKTVSSIEVGSLSTPEAQISDRSGIGEIAIDSINFGFAEIATSVGISALEVGSSAISSMLGEDYIQITGFNLLPGQQVEIDMCNFMVSINGENAIHLLDNTGDFFELLSGGNELEVVDRKSVV